MKVLVLGSNGQVGYELKRSCSVLGQIVCPTSADLNLQDFARLRSIVREVKPTHIVNAAAYTAVDKAEDEVNLVSLINAEAPGVLAEAAKDVGAKFIHYSTDYVFDGSKNSAYDESDLPCPINEYGKSKLLGEKNIQQVGGSALILRVSWVYSLRGTNFFKTISRLAAEREELRIVSDQVGAPTWARSIAEATSLISKLQENSEAASVYHMTPSGSASWYEFTEAIVSGLNREGHPVKVDKITPILSSEYPVKARRPKNSVMDSGKLLRDFGLQLPHWHDSLRMVLEDRNLK